MSVRKIAATLSVSCVALAASGAFAHEVSTFTPDKALPSKANPERVIYDPADPRPRDFSVILKDVSDASVATVEQYFRGFGFKTEFRPRTNRVIVHGTYAQAEAAGNFKYESVPLGPTTIRRASRRPSFGGRIDGLVDHTTFNPGPRMHAYNQVAGHVARPLDTDTGIPYAGYGPPDIAQLYDIPSTIPGTSTKLDGSGQTVVIASCGQVTNSDFSYFQSLYSSYLTESPSFSAVQVDYPTPNYTYYGLEPTLDVERVYGTAQGASILEYTIPDCTVAEWEDMVAQIVDDQPTNKAVAITISYGFYEGVLDYYGDVSTFIQGSTGAAAAIAGLAAQGVSIFAASGDSGSFFYYPWSPDIHIDVSYPASDTNVIAVGGTTLLATGATGPGTTEGTVTRTDEHAWSGAGCSGDNCNGSGGGISSINAAPPWQVNKLGLAAGAMKHVPDVAALADPFTGATTAWTPCYWIAKSPRPTKAPYYYPSCDPTEVISVGGTSASSPTLAGIAALLNQAAGSGAPILKLAKHFYKHQGDFIDITKGANGYYKARTGYDLVTGLGVPDVAKLLNDIK